MCGQENIDPRESFWSLFTHFVYDLTHFDSKFFTTFAHLIGMPGNLPSEYMRGRRARYLHPVRMYVFTSAVFFLIIYSMSSIGSANAMDAGSKDTIALIIPNAKVPKDISRESTDREYASIEEYDSIQNTLPENEKDDWLTRMSTQRAIRINKQFSGNSQGKVSQLINSFVHTFPYLMFVSLPLSTLVLQLLYIRNKNNLYVGHAVFLLYLYVFTFVLLLAYFALEKLNTRLGWTWVGYPQFMLIMYSVVYTVVAMKRFYGQGWGKTILKFIIWNTIAFFMIGVLFVIFFLLTLLSV